MLPRARLAALAASLCALPALTVRGQDAGTVAWIRQHALPIRSVEAGTGFDDLRAAGERIGGARVVALGEATHGSSEFFRLKHRMLEYLATEKGFHVFGIEANLPEAYRLNDYVLRGEGDPAALVAGLRMWPWATGEVLAMVVWMREFNASGRGPLQFTGFDMQSPDLAMGNAASFLARAEPDYEETARGLFGEAVRLSPANRPAGTASAAFPVEGTKGKLVRFSGFIRTEAVTNGYASLWWRVEGQEGPLSLATPGGRGATGTSGWRKYTVVATVPEEATGITFGVIHSGDGTAWFDSLSIEIAGIPAEAGFDLEFESLEGLQPRGEKHLLELDGANPHGGAFSLRSRYVGPAFPTARETAGMCAEVWRHMNERRQAYLDAGFDGRETDWAIQNARVAAQAAELAADPSSRDGAMAENVGWILDQNPGSKMVVWAHNGHVSASESSAAGSEPMGGFLRRALGQDVVLAGFSFNQGSFQAVDMQTRAVHPWSVGPAPAGTLDAGLADVGLPLFALDLREAPRAGAGSWLRTPLLTRSIGSVYDEAYARQYYNRTVPALAYDLLLFVERTTPSHLLDY